MLWLLGESTFGIIVEWEDQILECYLKFDGKKMVIEITLLFSRYRIATISYEIYNLACPVQLKTS